MEKWHFYLHGWLMFYGKLVGKYTSPMDPMGDNFPFFHRMLKNSFRK